MYHPVGVALAYVNVESHLLHRDPLLHDLVYELKRRLVVTVWTFQACVLPRVIQEVLIRKGVLETEQSASTLDMCLICHERHIGLCGQGLIRLRFEVVDLSVLLIGALRYMDERI